jgi:hypothetical protein
MRFAPTSRPLLWTVAASIAIALIGCASTDDVGDANDPAPATNDATAAKADDGKTRSGDDKDRPDFDPQFQNGADGGGTSTNDPTVDPTPPGGQSSCVDTDDPGSAENLAKKLPDTDDCDNNLKAVSGVANGGVDVDFYALQATDKGISFEHPGGCSLDTDFESETAGTEICVFARCRNATENAVTGCAEGTETTNAIGMKGCCAAGPGKAVPQWDCSGITDNDSADFFISVKQINHGEQCLPYKFKYRF